MEYEDESFRISDTDLNAVAETTIRRLHDTMVNTLIFAMKIGTNGLSFVDR